MKKTYSLSEERHNDWLFALASCFDEQNNLISSKETSKALLQVLSEMRGLRAVEKSKLSELSLADLYLMRDEIVSLRGFGCPAHGALVEEMSKRIAGLGF